MEVFMRYPKNLREESRRRDAALGSERIEFAKFAATCYLRQHLSDEEKALFHSYVRNYPNDWFERFDKDTGGVLGDLFRTLGYTEDFFGVPTLNTIYKEILTEALDQGPV